MSFHPSKDAVDGPAMTAGQVTPAADAKNAGVQQPRPKGHPVGIKATGLREKAWRTLRDKKKFTLNELLDINATGKEKDAPSNLLKYLGRLEQYGVLVRLARRAGDAMTSPGYVVWRLERDLGWDAPVWRNVQKVLWNPNTNSAVDLPAVNSDTATPGQGSAV